MTDNLESAREIKFFKNQSDGRCDRERSPLSESCVGIGHAVLAKVLISRCGSRSIVEETALDSASHIRVSAHLRRTAAASLQGEGNVEG